MRVIEVVIALFIIVMALGFTNILSISPSSSKYEATELEKIGYNVLHDLDKQNLLPRFVYSNDAENLTAALRITLPIDVYFNLRIYDVNFNLQNNTLLVRYGDESTFLLAKDVVSITYGLVGSTSYNSEYSPRVLVLQLTRG